MQAKTHPRQEERLAALQRYEILDTPREADFDEIVEFAAQICGTPIAVVNLIDAGRQWFKAETGLGVRATPLETSICSHVILENEFVEIPDTLSDQRTCDNALCTPQDGLRFYAGALLKTGDGLPIGTLCVLDRRPRQLTAFQKRSLEILARRVMRELDLRRALRDQATLRDEMDHRVKNSLQTIASFVRVYQKQLHRHADPAEVLDAVARRVEAVSALHEALHDTMGVKSVQLGDYVERIVGYLSQSAPPGILISCDTDACEVDAKLAGPVGVILSEAVANAIKHAFPSGQPGRINITLRATGAGVHISCQDNGAGEKALVEAIPSAGKSGLGTRLVAAAASQLGASLTREATGQGYRIELFVPVAAPVNA